MLFGRRRAALVVAVVVVVTVARADDGRSIIERARTRNGFATWTDRKSEVTMEGLQDGAGRKVRATVYERTDPRGEHRTLIEFSEPDDVRGKRLLHVAPRGEPDEYFLSFPQQRRVRRLAGNAAGSRHRDEVFFGTDMSYRDLELIVRILQWDRGAATATAEEDARCGDKPCFKVTLVPNGPNEFPFSRYELWFGRDDLLLDRVGLFDRTGEPIETITCDGYRPIGAFQTPRSCTIEHLKTESRAVITIDQAVYDSGLDDDLFTVAGLEQRH